MEEYFMNQIYVRHNQTQVYPNIGNTTDNEKGTSEGVWVEM